jgi:hypothetical protein
VEDAERLRQQASGKATATVGASHPDQAEPRAALAVPDPDQAGVAAGCPLDGHQIGGRIEVRGVPGLLAEPPPIPLPAVGARDVLPQLLVQLAQPVLVHPVGGEDLEPGRRGRAGQAGHRRIGGDDVGTLPPVDHKAEAHQAVAQRRIGFVDLGVEVAPDVPGDGVQQRSIRLRAAGAEGDEAAAVRSHQRRGPTDGQPATAGRPTVGCPGDDDLHGPDRTCAEEPVPSLFAAEVPDDSGRRATFHLT